MKFWHFTGGKNRIEIEKNKKEGTSPHLISTEKKAALNKNKSTGTTWTNSEIKTTLTTLKKTNEIRLNAKKRVQLMFVFKHLRGTLKT